MSVRSSSTVICCIDLEATCHPDWELADMEIIEIGAVLCGLDGIEISRFNTFVKPTQRPVLTEFCKDLTKITQAQVDDAPGLSDAFLMLQEWAEWCEPRCWISWGQFDEDLVRLECWRAGAAYPMPCEHQNAKKLFAKAQRFKKRVGLKTAVEKITKIGWVGRHHSGIDDARNLARMAPHIFGKIII